MTLMDSTGNKVIRANTPNPRARAAPFAIALVALLVALIFTPVIVTMINSGNDYPMHIWWASYWDQTGMVPSPLPHFLYQVLLIGAAHVLSGGNFFLAAAIVGVFCYISAGILLFTVIYPLFGMGSARVKTLATLLISVALLLVGPVNLMTWSSNNLLYGYIPANAYHNPTIVLLKPFALLLFLGAYRVFDAAPVSRLTLIATVVVTTLGTIAKPNYSIAFIPALALCVVVALYRKKPIHWALLIIGIVLPSCEVLLWQLNYMRGSGSGGFVLAPFVVMASYSPDNLLPKFVLSILFPVVVTVIYWPAARKDTRLRLAWVSFAVGTFYTYFLTEGQNYTSGNFTWSGQITLFILFVATAVFLVQQNRDILRARTISLKLGISIVVLLLHVVGGVDLYLAHLGAHWQYWI